MKRRIRISECSTRTLLAEGLRGWDITPLEGNFYIRFRSLEGDHFRTNYMPGTCPYKGLYVWLDLRLPQGSVLKSVAWLHWLLNPLLPFIWFRVALPGSHPDLLIEEFAV